MTQEPGGISEREITEIKRLRLELDAAFEFLSIVNEATGIVDLLRDVTAFIHERTGVEAVGIRIHQNEDYPYFETRGFSSEFVCQENSICGCDETGQPLRDDDGRAVLKCMCGNVLRSRFHPSKPFFTAHGSFWINSTTDLLPGATEDDRQSGTLNGCHGDGYESVALIPLRVGEERLGLLQLNDRRTGVFSPDMIAHWERLAGHLSAALSKFQAAEAVKKERDLARLGIDTVPRIILMLDTDQRVVLVNREAAEVAGYSPEEIIGKPWFDTFVPESKWAAAREMFQRAIAGEIDSDNGHESPIISKTGETRVVKWHSTALRDELGNVTGTLSCGEDIAEQKSAARLSFSQQRLALLVEQTPLGVIEWDTNFRVRGWNPAAELIFGFSKKEAFGQHANFIVPESASEHVDAIWQALLDQHGGNKSTNENVRKDGRRITCEWFNTPLVASDGKAIGAASLVMDITERKRAEEDLRQSESILHSFFESPGPMRGIVEVVGNDICYISVNAAMASFFRRTQESMRNIFATETGAPGETIQNWIGRCRESQQTGLPISFEFQHEADGEGRWLHALVSCLGTGPTGHPRFACLLDDVTENRRTQNLLHLQAQALARSNAEWEQFGYIASHDLQEPLRMISSYVQLLAHRYQGKLDSDADDFIGYAVDGAKRMHQLINDLLGYSRVSTMAKSFEPTDCEAAFDAAVANLGQAIRESEAIVTHDPLPTVPSDSAQMTQLLQNLIGNAIKFRNVEPPCVHVSAKQDNNEWVFSVRDNGIGIPREFHKRIFKVFQRLHAKEDYPGTGIGLAVCTRIIERHDGRIWVESEIGKGSTFCFTVPVRGERQV